MAELLLQLRPLPLEHRPLSLERPQPFRLALEILLQRPHGAAPLGQPVAHLLLPRAALLQLDVDAGEVPLRGGLLHRRGIPLALGLRCVGLRLGAILSGLGAPLAGVVQPLRGQREVTFEPADLELRVRQPALHLRAARLRRVTSLRPGLPLILALGEPRPSRRQGDAQLGGAHAQGAERQVEVLELASHQGERDPEPLFDHLPEAFGLAALARQAPHLRLNLGDQIFEPRQVRPSLLQPPLGAALAVPIQADARRFFEQRPPLLGALREEGVDHLGLHHDPGIRPQARPAQQILDVTQAHRRAVEEVFALPRARQPAADHDFLVRDRQGAV